MRWKGKTLEAVTAVSLEAMPQWTLRRSCVSAHLPDKTVTGWLAPALLGGAVSGIDVCVLTRLFWTNLISFFREKGTGSWGLNSGPEHAGQALYHGDTSGFPYFQFTHQKEEKAAVQPKQPEWTRHRPADFQHRPADFHGAAGPRQLCGLSCHAAKATGCQSVTYALSK